MGFNLFIHQRFNFERIHVAADDQAQIIDNKIKHYRIGQNTRITGEDFTLFWIFNIAFKGEHPLLA
ncbi:hypothetical protein [Salmonella enterica]|uniref:hypothetical protein n=1 Tax=Salmonella enterica TaxID=28901 RepID=UPI0030769453